MVSNFIIFFLGRLVHNKWYENKIPKMTYKNKNNHILLIIWVLPKPNPIILISILKEPFGKNGENSYNTKTYFDYSHAPRTTEIITLNKNLYICVHSVNLHFTHVIYIAQVLCLQSWLLFFFLCCTQMLRKWERERA